MARHCRAREETNDEEWAGNEAQNVNHRIGEIAWRERTSKQTCPNLALEISKRGIKHTRHEKRDMRNCARNCEVNPDGTLI